VAGRVVARALGRVPVKGRATDIMVYELLSIVILNLRSSLYRSVFENSAGDATLKHLKRCLLRALDWQASSGAADLE
jgi:hypothetical protein